MLSRDPNSGSAIPILRIGFFVLVAFAVCGCSTTAKIRQLEYERLTAERDALRVIEKALIEEPDPTIGRQAELFVGESGLNKLLAPITQFSFAIPKARNVAFKVNSARVDFRNGLALVNLDIQAEHLKHKFTVSLETHTQLEVVSPKPGESDATLNMRVLRMVPRAKWKFFHFRFGLFVHRLLRIKANEYVGKMPTVSIPLQTKMDFEFGGDQVEFEIGDATMKGPLNTPSLAGNVDVAIDRWYLLSDGLHVYLKLQESSAVTQ